MKCAVANCPSQNHEKDFSFFSFPINEELAKKWVNFCRRKKPFNYRTSLICMKHFAREDIQNAVEYEMGFAKKRILKRGVLPTIFKEEVISPKRKEKATLRQNRRIVRDLMKKYDVEHNGVEMDTDDSSMESMESVEITESNAPLLDMNNTIETPTSLEPFLETYRTSFEEFEDVEAKLGEQQKEINELRQENERQQEEISVVKHELEVMRLKTAALEKRVTRAESDQQALEKSLLKFLSKSQLSFLKYGTRRHAWSEVDIELAKFIYSTNRKVYKYLIERGFPIASIRTMQRIFRTTVPPVVQKKVSAEVPTVSTEAPTVSTEAPTVSSKASTVSTKAPTVSSKAPTVRVEAPPVHSEVLTVRVEVPSVHLELPPVHLEIPSANLEVPTVDLEIPTVHLEDHCYTV